MTKLEEIARAICRAEMLMVCAPEKWRTGELEIRVGQYWPRHMPVARAVMKVLRERNDAMDMAGIDVGPDRSHETYWQAMIDAILSEKTP